MQEENISFEEIGKDETARAEQSSSLFKQPIQGCYLNLHEELKARCAPENFMNPYEPEKVSKANELYSEVLTTNAQDDGKLKELRLQAMEELGVKFSTELLYEKLTAACNPKNFTGEAYNKERLELANRLYQAVLMNADHVLALEDIEGEAKELIEAYKPHDGGYGTLDNTKGSEEEISYEQLRALLIFFAITMAIILSCMLIAKYH